MVAQYEVCQKCGTSSSEKCGTLGKSLAHKEKTKQIGARVTPEKYAAVERIAEQLGLNIQKTVEGAIDALLTNTGIALPAPTPRPPHQGSTVERMDKALKLLDTLISGQRDIQDGVRQVLSEITRATGGKDPITEDDRTSSQSEHGETPGAPAAGSDHESGMDRVRKLETEIEGLEKQTGDPGKRVRGETGEHPKPPKGRHKNK